MLNIVTNAIDATEGRDGGEVRVETGFDSDTDSFFVTVSDNGPGISEDDLDRVFNIFESTKGARGTGLGLAVSRKIVREHPRRSQARDLRLHRDLLQPEPTPLRARLPIARRV